MAVIELFLVEIRVRERTMVARWYCETLGLKTLLDDRVGDFTLLAAGATRLAIKGGRDAEPSGSVALMFRVDDLEGERRRLAESGVQVSTIEPSPEGYRAIRLHDPTGHPIQLFEWVL